MTTTVSGSYPAVNSDSDATINGLTVGKGGGAVSNNTVVGLNAGVANTTGKITAFGYLAARFNTTGSGNTAVGGNDAAQDGALYLNTTGNYNIAVGTGAVASNTTGSSNTGLGYSALQNNTTASNNTAVGYQAGYSNTTSASNTFIGHTAGYSTTSTRNVFVGQGSGYWVSSGAKNVILGNFDGNQGGLDIRTASNHIVLSDGDGNPRLYLNQNGTIFVPRVFTDTTAAGANMFVDSSGVFYRSTSSLKYKKDVQNATHGLAEVLTLRPVTYKGKSEQDGNTVFGGLIAEEVDAVGLSEFVQYADDGSPDALAYGNMVSLCIKAIQELNAKIEAQALEIATLKGQ